MQKTKLGVSVGILGAALYFLGLINFLSMFILVGYILLFENNEWLRKTAVKATIIVISFFLVLELIGLGSNFFTIFNNLFQMFRIDFVLNFPYYLTNIATYIVNIIRFIVLIILGTKALQQGNIKIEAIDKVINKHMD